MKVLFYISKEIGEDNILWGLLELQYEVVKSELVVELDRRLPEQVEVIVDEASECDFVITRNFSVNVAEGCHIVGTPYLAWCYDSPVRALYLDEALYPTNYIFVFDNEQLKRLKSYGIKHVYYQPLAANMAKAQLATITQQDFIKNECEISFVGSMYNKGFYERFMRLSSSEVINECENVISKHLCKWDGSQIFHKLSDTAISELYSLFEDNNEDSIRIDHRYLTELLVLAPELTYRERFKILECAGKKFKTILHTRQHERFTDLISVKVLPPVDQLSRELYSIYSSAKINLNLTMRSIETGIPQRVYDIMSIGGCVFSNYQSDASELFEEDKEIVLFESDEEFIDKASYYLAHELERLKICKNGHDRVERCYDYPTAIRNMVSKL